LDPEPLSILNALPPWNAFAILLVLVILLACSALISGAEVAIFSLSGADLEREKQNPKISIIEKLVSEPKRLLATILIVNNFINIAIVLVYYHFSNSFLDFGQNVWLAFIIDVFVVTALILFFGEVLPKVYANRNHISFATKMANALHFLNRLLSPLNKPMSSLTLLIESGLGRQKTNLSVDQLTQALELTTQDDSNSDEQKLLEGIVSFGNTDTSQVMSPRIDICAIELTQSFDDVMKVIVDKGYSRVPVYDETIDHIVGVLFVKDLIPYINESQLDWTKLIRKPFFVPENKKLDDLLRDFQNMKSHLAIVVDEYGGTSGIVTLEDIIEEIVGDISDEFDEENINYSKIDSHTFIFEGKIALKDFYRIVAVDEEWFEQKRGESETLAGFILELLGNFPKKGQKIPIKPCQFEIIAVDNKRIKQVKVILNE